MFVCVETCSRLAMCPETRIAVVCHWGFIYEMMRSSGNHQQYQLHNCTVRFNTSYLFTLKNLSSGCKRYGNLRNKTFCRSTVLDFTYELMCIPAVGELYESMHFHQIRLGICKLVAHECKPPSFDKTGKDWFHPNPLAAHSSTG